MLDLGGADEVLSAGGRILDPGCGEGAFLLAILRRALWHAAEKGKPVTWALDRVHGVELDPAAARVCLAGARSVIENAGFKASGDVLNRLVTVGDFLRFENGNWDVVIGNPPYVRIEGLSDAQRNHIRRGFRSAVNRFDLYFAFFEHGISLLRAGGRLCFITPRKFMQVWSGSGLRTVLARTQLRRIQLLNEAAFPGLITYPAITVLDKHGPSSDDVLVVEDERTNMKRLVPVRSLGGAPWRAAFGEPRESEAGVVLSDVCDRIGVGIATGADDAFTVTPDDADGIPEECLRYWVGGRQLPKGKRQGVLLKERIVWPYDGKGELRAPEDIPEVISFLSQTARRQALERRSCVGAGRPWYAFHERPRPEELAQPKILTQDIQLEPEFHLDLAGTVPKHSVYYLVPKRGVDIRQLLEHLNGPLARKWLQANCQPAAGGRIRLQAMVLRDLPVPGPHRVRRQAKLGESIARPAAR